MTPFSLKSGRRIRGKPLDRTTKSNAKRGCLLLDLVTCISFDYLHASFYPLKSIPHVDNGVNGPIDGILCETLPPLVYHSSRQHGWNWHR